MTISINQTVVDFTLDTETNLGEVLTSLETWAAAQQWRIAAVLVNGKADFQPALPIGQVATLEMETVPCHEEEASRWEVVAAYFTLVAQASAEPALLQDLHGEFGPVRQKVTAWAGTSGSERQALADLEGPWGPPVERPALVLAEAARKRAEDFRNPAGALDRAMDALKSLLAGRSHLAGLFQKGNDADALAWVLELFAAIHEVGLWAGGQPEWTKLWAELPDFLRETETALGTQDYVLATDLIEYEIGPRVEETLTLLRRTDNLDRVPGVL